MYMHADENLTRVYFYLASAEYQLGNIKMAAKYLRDILQNGNLIITNYCHVVVYIRDILQNSKRK